MTPGTYTLIHIPRGSSAANVLLRVEAEARRLGGRCGDVYFQELNVTGRWAEPGRPGGLHFSARDASDKDTGWVDAGRVRLKVVHGHTQQGTRYLNFYVRHLASAGLVVGGLLGEDDHTEAEEPASPWKECSRRLSVLQSSSLVEAAPARTDDVFALSK